MLSFYTDFFQSPIGLLTIEATPEEILRIRFGKYSEKSDTIPLILNQCKKELAEYFQQKRKKFTVPYGPKGTPFQMKVWGELEHIPYGTTLSYKEVAIKVGSPQGARAIGRVNNQNPLPILIPCHRVIGHNGKMVGYGQGIPIKEKLLKLEVDPLD